MEGPSRDFLAKNVNVHKKENQYNIIAYFLFLCISGVSSSGSACSAAAAGSSAAGTRGIVVPLILFRVFLYCLCTMVETKNTRHIHKPGHERKLKVIRKGSFVPTNCQSEYTYIFDITLCNLSEEAASKLIPAVVSRC